VGWQGEFDLSWKREAPSEGNSAFSKGGATSSVTDVAIHSHRVRLVAETYFRQYLGMTQVD
jgi:hypothetical protein